MTFKNVKFDDSAVMRSLEKLAVKKGLVQPETMKKEASAAPKTSLNPTGDLTQDLLKLCDGLRKAGFSKYADDVETKFVQLKKAESLYETSKETGEAFLDDAHPEGSVKLKDMDGDATVETVADIKKKIEDLVKKTPKGKLANQDFINLVKISLAEGEVGPLGIIAEQLAKGRSLWQVIDKEVDSNTSGWALQWSENFEWGTISKGIKTNLSRKPEDMTTDRIEKLFADIRKAYEFVTSRNKEDLVARLKGAFGQMLVLYGPMRKARDTYNEGQSQQLSGKPVAEEPKSGVHTIPEVNIIGAGPVEAKIEALKSKVSSFKAQVGADMELSPQEKKTALSFLDSKTAELESQAVGFANVPEMEQQSASAKFLKNVAKIEGQLQEFYNNWIA